MKNIKVDNSNRIALFGGSFDPIHAGHITIIKRLAKMFERVIIVPGFITPFKEGSALIAPEHRLSMIKAAINGIDNVEVSNYEINKNSVCYSYETAEHFFEKYGDKLSFVIGSEMLNSLSKWKEFKTLKKLVRFFVINREGYGINAQVLENLRNGGANIDVSKIKVKDISSSLARVAIAFNKSSPVGKENFNYIKENKLYTEYDEIFKAYKVFKLKKERIEHTFRTVKSGIQLCKIFDGDINKVITAVLIHDIAKHADDKVLSKYNISLTKNIKSLPPQIVHAFVSELIAKSYFNITDKDILGAIRKHTTADPKMNKTEKIVYLADYIEEGREIDGLYLIREAAFRSLDEGMGAALKRTIEHLDEEGEEIYFKTREAYAVFAEFKTLDAEKVSAAKTVKKAVKNISAPSNSPYDLAYTIAQYADDKKGRDITLIDLNGKTIIADYFVLVTVTSTTAVRALTDFIDEQLSKVYNIEPLRRDIDPKWSAIDYGSVIMHIFTEETRSFYSLERLWSDGSNIERL